MTRAKWAGGCCNGARTPKCWSRKVCGKSCARRRSGQRAVLLRVAPLGATKQRLTFDDIATIDLGGKGIRELTISEG